jgi:hypothetical protein
MIGKYLLFYSNFLPHVPRYIDTRAIYRVTDVQGTRKCKLELAKKLAPLDKPKKETIMGDHVALVCGTLEGAEKAVELIEVHQTRAHYADKDMLVLLKACEAPSL